MANLKQMGPLVNSARDMLGIITDMGFDVKELAKGNQGDLMKNLDFSKLKIPENASGPVPATEEEENKVK